MRSGGITSDPEFSPGVPSSTDRVGTSGTGFASAATAKTVSDRIASMMISAMRAGDRV